jgi:ketosteroid isomerase-like protein
LLYKIHVEAHCSHLYRQKKIYDQPHKNPSEGGNAVKTISTPSQAQLRAVAERYYTLVDQRDFENLFRMFTDDVVYERGNYERIVGIEDFRAFYLKVRTIQAGKHTIDEILSDGESVAVRGTFDGVLTSGSPVHLEFMDLHKFRDSRIYYRYTYFKGPPA